MKQVITCLSQRIKRRGIGRHEKAKPITTATNPADRSGETRLLATSQTVPRFKNHAAIRQALMKDGEFHDCEEHQSHYAKGHVTLRGTLRVHKKSKNRQFKSAAGAAKIENQLEFQRSN